MQSASRPSTNEIPQYPSPVASTAMLRHPPVKSPRSAVPLASLLPLFFLLSPPSFPRLPQAQLRSLLAPSQTLTNAHPATIPAHRSTSSLASIESSRLWLRSPAKSAVRTHFLSNLFRALDKR